MTASYAATVAERLDGERRAGARRELDTLVRRATRMRQRVQALLNDARAGGRRVRRRPINLNLMLRACLSLLAPQIRARGADVCVADLPVIRSEEAMFSAVFTSLVTNALRYSPRRGQIAVGVTRDNGLALPVQSQGPPIPSRSATPLRALPPRPRRRPRRGDLPSHRGTPRRPDQPNVSASNDTGNHFYLTLPRPKPRSTVAVGRVRPVFEEE